MLYLFLSNDMYKIKQAPDILSPFSQFSYSFKSSLWDLPVERFQIPLLSLFLPSSFHHKICSSTEIIMKGSTSNLSTPSDFQHGSLLEKALLFWEKN